MTDEIMIDGVDVSGCEFFCKMTDRCLDYKRWYDKPPCKQVPDCHYKQLKRKEEELKMETSVREAKQDIINMLNNKYYNLEEQLQAELQKVKTLEEKVMELREGYDEEDCTTTCPNIQVYERKIKELKERLAITNFETENLRDSQEPIIECLNLYKQALEEIKGLSQSINDDFENDDIEQQLHYCKEIAELITHKCEVLND